MDDQEWLADRFEEHRPHLRAVAYRMLGSLTEAASGRWSTPSWPRPARGDLEALVAVLDPDVVLRAEPAGSAREVHGAQAVASAALGFAWLAGHAHPVLVNGAAGLVAAPQGRLASVLDG
jgi:hypothetical protein